MSTKSTTKKGRTIARKASAGTAARPRPGKGTRVKAARPKPARAKPARPQVGAARRTRPTSAPSSGVSAHIPVGAAELKARLGQLATARGRIKTLRRSLDRNFHEIGTLLAQIEDEGLHQVKGYGSFEAFLEREVDLGVQLGLKLLRIARTFHREAAQAAGLERTTAALDALEGHEGDRRLAAGSGGSALPPHKR